MAQVDPMAMPVVKARPLGELVQRAADRGAMNLPAPAAAPSPMTSPEVAQLTSLASPTVSPATAPASAPFPQPAQPISQPMAETEMPTMIMPTPAAVTRNADVSTSPPVQEPAATEAESLGLEAVWPVQRKTAPASRPDETSLDPVEAVEPVRHEKPEAQKVQQVMRQVAAAKPTDSSVELILPRRQRPNVPARPVQRQPESNGQSHDPGSGAGQPTPQAYVPTEIGPLPGDLWELLGEKPPTQPQPGDGQMVMRAAAPPVSLSAPAASPTPFAERSFAPASPVQRQTAAPPPQAPMTNSGPAMIQRAETSAAASSSTTVSSTEGGEGSEGGESEVNVDELARQVYREIKQRLAVEWERGRGRF